VCTPTLPQPPSTAWWLFPPPRNLPCGEAWPNWGRQLPLLLWNPPSFPFPALWERRAPKQDPPPSSLPPPPQPPAPHVLRRVTCPQPAITRPHVRHPGEPGCWHLHPQKQQTGPGSIQGSLCTPSWGYLPCPGLGRTPETPPSAAPLRSPAPVPTGLRRSGAFARSRKELEPRACRPAGTGGLAKAGSQSCRGPLPPEGFSRSPPPLPGPPKGALRASSEVQHLGVQPLGVAAGTRSGLKPPLGLARRPDLNPTRHAGARRGLAWGPQHPLSRAPAG